VTGHHHPIGHHCSIKYASASVDRCLVLGLQKGSESAGRAINVVDASPNVTGNSRVARSAAGLVELALIKTAVGDEGCLLDMSEAWRQYLDLLSNMFRTARTQSMIFCTSQETIATSSQLIPQRYGESLDWPKKCRNSLNMISRMIR
jgi:hypothetical protein